MQIRPVRPDDAEQINAIRRQESVLLGTLALPGERVEQTRKFLEGLGPEAHLLVAELDGQVVGLIGLHVKSGRMRHSATVGMMVHEAFQGRGIGTALMAAILDLADRWLNLHRVELEVFPDNERALRLYRRFGFVEEGRKRDAVWRDGRYSDLLVMARVRGGSEP